MSYDYSTGLFVPEWFYRLFSQQPRAQRIIGDVMLLIGANLMLPPSNDNGGT